MRKRKPSFVLALYFSITICGFSQQVTPLSKSIDSLFQEWNTTSSPGCVVGVVRNDSVLYAKGFGLANLEHRAPITSTTLFNTASLSKQFTGYAILTLLKARKLQLDDPIQKHLPWMPTFGKKITIGHLLHHTSGIRDHLIMAIYGGSGYNGIINQDYALRYIKNYRGLNFEPGEKHVYSNSNYVLLAEIVKAVSGLSFNAYVDSVIFKPLGMNHSFFAEDHSAIINNRAVSYAKTGNNYVNNFQNVYTVGDGGLFSTITDMCIWSMSLYQREKESQLLVQPDKLNSGYPVAYGMGLGVVPYKGYATYTHSGSLAGYRSFIMVFPQLKLGIVVMSNLATIRTSVKAREVADLFLKSLPVKEAMSPAFDSSRLMVRDTFLAKSLHGDYIAEDGQQLQLFYQNQRLYLKRFSQPELLAWQGNNTLSNPQDTGMTIRFIHKPEDTVIHYLNYGNLQLLKKYRPDSTAKDFSLYTGSFYSPEFDVQYSIALKGDHLVLKGFQFNDTRMLLRAPDVLGIANNRNHFRMIRDQNGKIIGFDFSNDFVTKVRFVKTVSPERF